MQKNGGKEKVKNYVKIKVKDNYIGKRDRNECKETRYRIGIIKCGVLKSRKVGK